jgi:hypothetical protein
MEVIMGKAKELKKYLKERVEFLGNNCSWGCGYYLKGECRLFVNPMMRTFLDGDERCDECKQFFGVIK